MQATQAWEASAVQEPTIVAVAGGDRKWYSAGWTNSAIGTAFRATGNNNWTKYASNPIIGLGNGGVAGACGRPFVVEVAGVFHMFFNLNNGTTLKHCTSADGITFDTPADVFTGPWGTTFGNISIVVSGGTWHMIYEKLDTVWKMGYATSPDGTTWTNQAGPLTTLSRGGSYGGPDLHGVPGAWELYYHASTSGFLPTDIYKAASTNLTTWDQQPLQVTRTKPWEVDQVADPFVRMEDGALVMYYAGVDNPAEASKISRATHT